MGFTKGPWKAGEVEDKSQTVGEHARGIIAENDEIVCFVLGSFHGEIEEDINLIAAAPDMYEALKELRENCDYLHSIDGRNVLRKIDKALAKADGK